MLVVAESTLGKAGDLYLYVSLVLPSNLDGWLPDAAKKSRRE
jgi:hypothetical protein